MKILSFLDELLNKNECVNYINGSEVLAPPLSKEEEEKYTQMYLNGDIRGRNKLIEHNLRLVVYVAKRFETNITNLEDLISIGTIGLVKAINTFKLSFNDVLNFFIMRFSNLEIYDWDIPSLSAVSFWVNSS